MLPITSRFPCSGIATTLLAMMIAAVGAPATAREPKAGQMKSRVVRANPPVVFAHLQSDLAVDPGARFGRLANGMTYVIYKNKTPPGVASVWMRVAAGSVMEQDNQRGLAHFIEHMAFNGSKNVPEGEMVKLLERDGLQFGADTNAQTSFFETVYMLNLPDAKNRVVDDALFLMRETAGNLLFNSGAIDRERGVVLGEERARASVGAAADEAQLKQILPGMKYPERMPIGKVEVLKTAQRPVFMQFYNDFYRPEYTTLMVVGDVDPDRIETEIKQRFSDWRSGPQSVAALTDFGKLAARSGPEAKLFLADGLADTIAMSWVTPPVDIVETKAKDADDIVSVIAGAILNERYARAAKLPASAFAEAGLQRQDIMRTARLYSLNIRPKDGQDRAAFDQAVAMLRQYLAVGPTQAELDRVLQTHGRFFKERAAAARTISTQEIIGQLLRALGTQGVPQSPAQALAEYEELRPGFTLAAINAALRRIKFTDRPVLWRQGEHAAPLDEPALLETYRTAMAAPLATYASRTAVDWPYTYFGPPSAIVSRETLPNVGATRVTFANGVVLTVKQTDLEDNAVGVSVQFGNGLLGVRADQGATLFIAKQVGLDAGGLGKMTSDDMREVLTGKIYGLGFGIGNNATTLSGMTTRADLSVQMQVLTAFATDPAFRPEALERVKAALPSGYDARRTSPDGVYSLKAAGDPYSGDPRFTTPQQRDALAVDNESVKALLKDQLGHGPVDVTIVGDITPDEAIAQVGATLGASPKLPTAVVIPDAVRLSFPTSDLHRTYMHDGRDDQNLSVIAWPTGDYYTDPRRAAALDVLTAIMTIRELEEVREKQGATYSASVNSVASRYFPGFGYIFSRATVRPEVDTTYYDTVSEIVKDLKRKPVTTDELTRARLPMIDRLRNEKKSNAYWLSVLSGTIRDPRQIATAEAQEHYLRSVTPKDVQGVALKYLDMSKALRIQIRPKGGKPNNL